MKLIPHGQVQLKNGFFFDKQALNHKVTIHAVYDRFAETGRIGAFKFGYPDNDPIQPHFFWDSDVAKWIEGAAYILKHTPDPALEAKIDALVDDIAQNQGEDGYFNIFFTVVQPENRFANRDWHELYCAGHLMEAACAYYEATGRDRFLKIMEKEYPDPSILLQTLNPKGALQEYTQSVGAGVPQYRIVSVSGPDHEPIHKVEVLVRQKVICQAEASGRKQAECLAAKQALQILLKKDEETDE